MLLVKQVFVNKDGSTGILYLVSSDIGMTYKQIIEIYRKRWNVECYHKSLKQNVSLEKFGPPNVATIDGSGKEVWVYQKNATVSNSSQNNTYWTLILLSGTGVSSGTEQSSRTMTLILKFDKNKRVADFNSMTTSF